MTGWDQTIRGGILYTMLDEIMGWRVIYPLKKIGMAQSPTVTFKQTVHASERLTIVGGIQAKQSERSELMEAVIFDADNILCVKATKQSKTKRP